MTDFFVVVFGVVTDFLVVVLGVVTAFLVVFEVVFPFTAVLLLLFDFLEVTAFLEFFELYLVPYLTPVFDLFAVYDFLL